MCSLVTVYLSKHMDYPDDEIVEIKPFFSAEQTEMSLKNGCQKLIQPQGMSHKTLHHLSIH